MKFPRAKRRPAQVPSSAPNSGAEFMAKILQLGYAIVVLSVLGFITDKALVQGDNYAKARNMAQVLAAVRISDYARSAETLNFSSHPAPLDDAEKYLIRSAGPLGNVLIDVTFSVGNTARVKGAEYSEIIKDALTESGMSPTFAPMRSAQLLPVRRFVPNRDDLTIEQICEILGTPDAARNLEQVVPDKERLKARIKDTLAANDQLRQSLYGINLLQDPDSPADTVDIILCDSRMAGEGGACLIPKHPKAVDFSSVVDRLPAITVPVEGSNFKLWYEQELRIRAAAVEWPIGTFDNMGEIFGDVLFEIRNRTPEDAVKYLDEKAKLASADLRFGDLFLPGVRTIRALPIGLAFLCVFLCWNLYVLARSPRAVVLDAVSTVTYALYFRRLGGVWVFIFAGAFPAGFTWFVRQDLCLTYHQIAVTVIALGAIGLCTLFLAMMMIWIRRQVTRKAPRI